MKLHNSNSTDSIVSSQGVGSSSTFGIANNSHMFQILSSGLYSDKVGAVLREVGCNAFDAHAFIGKADVPFQVKLPTRLDRTFFIKDFGPGLDDEEIKNIYTIYGVSTKQACLEQTGGFGLGSKSPFAYTLFDSDNPDGFTIVSAKNGVQRTYVAHLNDEGAPVVSLLNEQAASADWPNGVQVMFPVQDRDIPEFHEKAVEIFQWFKVIPEILGIAEEVKSPSFDIDGDTFKIPTNHSYRPRGNASSVVMANVRYPIQVSQLGELSRAEIDLLEAGIYLFVDNGDVVMTPSRESLQYTERTRRSIRKGLSNAIAFIASQILNEFESEGKSELVRLRTIHKSVEKLPYQVKDNISEFLKFMDIDKSVIARISSAISSRLIEIPPYIGTKNGEAESSAAVSLNGTKPTEFKVRAWAYYKEGSAVKRTEILHGKSRQGTSGFTSFGIDVKEDCYVIYADGSTHSRERIQNLFKVNGGNPTIIHLVNGKDGTLEDAKTLAEKLISADEGIEGIEIKAASELVLPASFKAQRDLRKGKNPLEEDALKAALSSLEVMALDVKTNEVSKMKLGDLKKSGHFYTSMNKATKAIYETNKSLGIKLAISRYSVPQFLHIANAILGKLYGESSDEVVTHIVIVDNQTELKRLGLVELGFKPYLSHIQNVSYSYWSEILEGFDFVVRYSNHNSYILRRFNSLAYPLVLASTYPEAWNQAVADKGLLDSPVVKEIKELVAQLDISDSNHISRANSQRHIQSDQLTSEMVSTFLGLLDFEHRHFMKSCISHDNGELATKLINEFPLLDLLSSDYYIPHANTIAEEEQKMLGLLDMIKIVDANRKGDNFDIVKNTLVRPSKEAIDAVLAKSVVGEVSPVSSGKLLEDDSKLNAA